MAHLTNTNITHLVNDIVYEVKGSKGIRYVEIHCQSALRARVLVEKAYGMVSIIVLKVLNTFDVGMGCSLTKGIASLKILSGLCFSFMGLLIVAVTQPLAPIVVVLNVVSVKYGDIDMTHAFNSWPC